jgi:hypothetical protein
MPGSRGSGGRENKPPRHASPASRAPQKTTRLKISMRNLIRRAARNANNVAISSPAFG